MDSENIALVIAGGGLLLGVARLLVAIASYRLDAHRSRREHPARGNFRKHARRDTLESASADEAQVF